MNVPLSWLKEYVDVTIPPAELAHRLTMAGVEASEIHRIGDWEECLVGQVTAVRAHPQADRLRLCQVNTGSEEVEVVCGAANVDPGYPYANGALGPVAGWDLNWRRFVSSEDTDYTDLMSYCGRYEFISDYQYRIASSRRPRSFSVSGTPGVQSSGQAGGSGPLSAGAPLLTPESDADGGLALSGRVDASGQWSLTHVQGTDRGPRAPAPDGQFTLILLDGDDAELYREPLSVSLLSHSDEAGWTARTPVPASPVRQAVILDAQGVEVLRVELPAELE